MCLFLSFIFSRNTSEYDEKCLVAIGATLVENELEKTLWDLLTEEFKPVCVICPYIRNNQSLIVFNNSIGME